MDTILAIAIVILLIYALISVIIGWVAAGFLYDPKAIITSKIKVFFLFCFMWPVILIESVSDK